MEEFNFDKDKKTGVNSHKDLLGMEVPEGYFKKSKEDILKAISAPKTGTSKVIKLTPLLNYAIAASLILLVGLSIYFKLHNETISPQLKIITPTEVVNLENDHSLINSLFIDNEDIDSFLDDYVVNEVVIKVQESEMELDNMLINSLMVDDSLLDNYIDESFVENIVL